MSIIIFEEFFWNEISPYFGNYGEFKITGVGEVRYEKMKTNKWEVLKSLIANEDIEQLAKLPGFNEKIAINTCEKWSKPIKESIIEETKLQQEEEYRKKIRTKLNSLRDWQLSRVARDYFIFRYDDGKNGKEKPIDNYLLEYINIYEKDFEKNDYREYAKQCGWAIKDEQLKALVAIHKDGNEKQKEWIVDFLDDCNFHSEARLLEKNKNDELMEIIQNEIDDDIQFEKTVALVDELNKKDVEEKLIEIKKENDERERD